MAGPSHLAILKEGVKAWNEWRAQNPLSTPDFTEAHLQKADLPGVNLQGADLQRADFRRANLQEADLQAAILEGANLQGADLRGANLQEATLQGAILLVAILEGTNLQEAILDGANLQAVDLRRANLRRANLRRVDLQAATLQAAILDGANLQEADLRRANLQEADLQAAILQGANLQEATLPGATLPGAILEDARGLTQEQIEQAFGDETTTLPEPLYPPGRCRLAARAGTLGGAANDTVEHVKDQLGFVHYVEAFAELIDSPNTDPPLTIGIYGSWGMGKSFLLKNIGWKLKNEKFKNRPQLGAVRRPEVYVVDFNAWEYSAAEVIWPGLRKLLEFKGERLTWEELRRIRQYTVNFNPAVEGEMGALTEEEQPVDSTGARPSDMSTSQAQAKDAPT